MCNGYHYACRSTFPRREVVQACLDEYVLKCRGGRSLRPVHVLPDESGMTAKREKVFV